MSQPILPTTHLLLEHASTESLFNMGRRKRSVRERPAAEPTVQPAEPPSSPSPLSQLASTVASVSLSAERDEVKHDLADEEAATSSDSEAPPAKRTRKKLGHYNKPLTTLERLEVLRLHISEGKTAASISQLFAGRGLTVPVSTIYTLIRKQAKGLPIEPKPRHRRTTYTEDDAKLVVQAQKDHNDFLYADLKKTWMEAHPDAEKPPCNHTPAQVAGCSQHHREAPVRRARRPQRAVHDRPAQGVQPARHDVVTRQADLHRRDDVQQVAAQHTWT